MAKIGADIEQASQLLLDGELVAIPTETVYGLAANALNQETVLQIFEAKQRPFFDPLIIHLPSKLAVEKYANFHDQRLLALAETFWPGPLTLLLPKKDIIPDLVTSGLSQVAVRVPQHELTLKLLNRVGIPLAAPSANPFGYVSPTSAQHVNDQLGEQVSYILDGGSSQVGIESTIVGIENDKLCVFRLGGLALEDIEKKIGKIELRLNNSSNPRAPGQLENHYAPRKNLYLGNVEEFLAKYANKKISLITFGNKSYNLFNGNILHLSKQGSLKEAALNLFNYLRLADADDSEIVLCETVPDEGLGKAINDRLRRASAKSTTL